MDSDGREDMERELSVSAQELLDELAAYLPRRIQASDITRKDYMNKTGLSRARAYSQLMELVKCGKLDTDIVLYGRSRVRVWFRKEDNGE